MATPQIMLTVPPHATTVLTGFLLGAERQIYGTTWKVEYWLNETYPRVFRNGESVATALVPKHVVKFINHVTRNILTPMTVRPEGKA